MKTLIEDPGCPWNRAWPSTIHLLLDRPDGTTPLAAIRHPTLHVFGTADPVGSADLWRRVSSRLPHGRLSIVERAGHMPWFDESTRVAEEVGDFLGAPSTPPGSSERRSRGLALRHRDASHDRGSALSKHRAVPGREHDATLANRERLKRCADGLGDRRLT